MNDFEAGASGSALAEFDVFLNHRGPDVKATFVAHLEDALQSAGFRPFLDVKSLRKSNPALQSIDQALATAKVHIAIVSPGYAESKYCLKELVAMIRSGKLVVPVFYGVEPVDLRWVENGPFAEAFKRHKERGRSERKLLKWRDALAVLAGGTGFRLADYKCDEARLKREVVDEVARLTPSNQPVAVDECRVGLEGPTHACIEVLGSMSKKVGLLGLVGMGGVGKTTLAREIYNHYASSTEFKFMTFLEVHRDCSSSDVQVRSRWHSNLQEQLLWDLLRTQDKGSSYGTLFQRVSTLGPVFIVVDDIHSLGQFQELVPSFGVLCPGSRVIVTSRDQSVVNNFVDKASEHFIYKMSELGVGDANMLFNLHAFHSRDAPVEYKDIAKSVVEACGGLPLALKVMGSSLFDKRLDGDREGIWMEAIDALRACEDVMGVLRWSYKRLNASEKLMFMDITCLFNHHSVEKAFAYWESCKHSRGYVGLCALHTSLRNLVNKSLVCVEGTFKVHGLLGELGQRIAMNAKRHLTNDDFLVDEDKVETIGLNIVGCKKRKFKAIDFGNMPNLLALRLPDGCKLDGDFGCMSKKLRLLQWRSMPLERVPAGLNLSLLTSLDLSYSTKLASIWTESNCMQESFVNLHSLDLTGCTSITRLPDSVGQSLQLQYLKLSFCGKLKKLPYSIGQLKALKVLNLEGCWNLESLPHIITCPNLIDLILSGCLSITKLPDSIGELRALENLEMRGCRNLKTLPDGMACPDLRMLILEGCTSITKLPDSIGKLRALTYLDLSHCSNLETLPRSVACPNLTLFELRWCTSITKLPDFLGHFLPLFYLSLSDCRNLRTIPDSIGQLKVLKHLYIDGCRSLKTLPHSIGALLCLEHFYAGDCTSLVEIPSSIELLSSLKHLRLGPDFPSYPYGDALFDEGQSVVRHLQSSCPVRSLLESGALESLTNLRSLQIGGLAQIELPEPIGLLIGLKFLHMENCRMLEHLPNSIGDLKFLIRLELTNCHRLKRLPKNLGALARMKCLIIENCWAITKLPRSMGLLSQLGFLKLESCTNLRKLPASITQLESLENFGILNCGSIEAMGALRTLQGLRIWGTTSITKLPSSLNQVSRLIVRESSKWQPSKDDYIGREGLGWSCWSDIVSFEVLEEDASGVLGYDYFGHDKRKEAQCLVRYKPWRKPLELEFLQ